MEKHFSIIGGFFLRTVLLLIPMLALWYWAREWVVAPPAWLAGKLYSFSFHPGCWVSSEKAFITSCSQT
jgi:hypothetical protein